MSKLLLNDSISINNSLIDTSSLKIENNNDNNYSLYDKKLGNNNISKINTSSFNNKYSGNLYTSKNNFYLKMISPIDSNNNIPYNNTKNCINTSENKSQNIKDFITLEGNMNNISDNQSVNKKDLDERTNMTNPNINFVNKLLEDEDY